MAGAGVGGRAGLTARGVNPQQQTRFFAALEEGISKVTVVTNTVMAIQHVGSVRKEMSQIPHGTSQRNHSGIAFRELVEARHDASVLFQPAKHALDDVALSVLGPVKQPG